MAASGSILRKLPMSYWLTPAVLLILLGLLAGGVLGSAGFALGVVVLMLFLLVRQDWPAEVVVLGALTALVVGSLLADGPFLATREALAGLSNTGVVTVALLFIVAAGVQRTGIMERLAGKLLGQGQSERRALVRLAGMLVGLSAFLNNTPIVAIFMPMVRDWACRQRIAPSKLLIPLSYFTIFGGVCTLIGTSTNLVVDGLMRRQGLPGMGMFELAWLGLPAALAGTLYVILIGPRLLPNYRDMLGDADAEIKEYLVEAEVAADSKLAGQSIEQAGLRELEGLFLFQVRRGAQNFAPIKREFVLQVGDRLTFAGGRDRVLAVTNLPGLTMPHVAQHLAVGTQSQLIEVVISTSSPLLGKTLKETRFNRKYDATVLAIHRNGERIAGQLGDTLMQAGDTLLLIAGIGFRRIWQNSADFYLVSPLRQDLSVPSKMPIALAILVLMIALPTFGLVPLEVTAAVAVMAMVLSNILPPQNLLRQVDWNVVAVIAAAFGISAALEQSGASQMIAQSLIGLASGWGAIGVLVAVYVLTNLFTEVITNNAAAALVFPIAYNAATMLQVNPRPFMLVIAMAASASFATPIGYTTNMMVYGPGGYRYADYLRIGLPLNFIYGSVTLFMAWFWWFRGA